MGIADAVTNRSYGCAIERPFLFTVRMTGKPEVIGSSAGLVPRNALVSSDLVNSWIVGKPEVILASQGARQNCLTLAVHSSLPHVLGATPFCALCGFLSSECLVSTRTQTFRLTAEMIENLSAASGLAYKKLRAIFPSLVAPAPAPTLAADEKTTPRKERKELTKPVNNPPACDQADGRQA
jgi:hypothetical protein